MASHDPPSPPPPPPPAPTTINALTDDLLREIFLRLPDLPSLTCVAFTCRAFLRAVSSSPAFRRRFRELHAPHILALFIEPYMRAFVPAVSHTSDTGITAAFSDLLRDDGSSEWMYHPEAPYSDGYVFFVNRNTEQNIFYNVHTQTLNIYPKKSHVGVHTFLEFHTLPADRDGQRPSRVVCVHHDSSWAWARLAILSSHAMEWQVIPEPGTPLLEGGSHPIGTVIGGFICWLYEDCILALDIAKFQFSLVDLPSPSAPDLNSSFNIGQTKDGELCLVGAQECTLSVWLLTPDNGGVQRFVLHKAFPLHTSLKEVTQRPVEDIVDVGSQLIMAIDGFVYLAVVYNGDPQSWFVSVCLETADVKLLFKRTCCSSCFDPYIMAWPPAMIHNEEDSETEVIDDSVADNGRVGIEEASPVLFRALRSFKEALIDDDNAKFVYYMDSFLLDDEVNSLLNKISTLDAGLAAARDRVLKIGGHSDIKKERIEREGWWRLCKGMLRRARPSCFAS